MALLSKSLNLMTSINYDLVITEDEICYIEYDGSYFKINTNTYRLLHLLKQNQDISRIAQDMNVDITEVNNAITQIKKMLTKQKIQKKIKHLFTFMNKDFCNFLGNRFDFLFHQKLFYILFILGFLSTILSFFQIHDKSLLSLRVGFLGYLFALLAILFFHEFGHVCAASHFRLKNLKISVGVYFIWPIFYVDLNQQVLLPREKRIIVSTGGLYFQLLLNLLCIALNNLFDQDILVLILYLNSILFLVNAAPILILDGYWIYSDWFQIEHLDAKAKALQKNLIFNFKTMKTIPISIWVYTLIRLLSILLIYLLILYYLTFNMRYFPDMLYLLREETSFNILFRAVSLTLPYLLFLTYLSKIIYGRLSERK